MSYLLLLLLGAKLSLAPATQPPPSRVEDEAAAAAATGESHSLKSFGPALGAAREGDGIAFIVAGDNRSTAKDAPSPRVLDAILSEIGLIHPDFVLWTGDTVYGYCDTQEELHRELERFVETARKTGVPIFNAPGNHEIHFDEGHCYDEQGVARLATGGTATSPDHGKRETCKGACAENLFVQTFGPLYGSFDYAGAHFVAIDAEKDGNKVPDDEMGWLEADLKKAAPKPAFVFGHTEFFSSPLIDDNQRDFHKPIGNRDQLHDLFRRYSVKVVFSGHEHLYWRESAIDHDGIDYFVAGGAGAPFYTQPQFGGFSHYLLVRLSAEGKISYRVIEPGHLYMQTENGRKSENDRNWIVNSNDADITVRGADLKVPRVHGDCHRFGVEGEQRDWEFKPKAIKIDVSNCWSEGQTTHFVLSLTSPRGSSVLLTLRKIE